MKLILYHTEDSPNTLNKRKILIYDTSIALPRSANLEYLEMKLITDVDLSEVNYCLIEGLGYYFINEIDSSANFYSLNCRPDLLETYSQPILKSAAVVTFSNNPSYAQTSKNYDVRKEVNIYKSDVDVPYNPKIIVTVV